MAQALAPVLPPDYQLRVGYHGQESNHEALLRGEIDLYADYAGTALRRYLHLTPLPREEVYPAVRDAAFAAWDVVWLEPFGFDNSYGLIVRAAAAEARALRSISDLAAHAARLVLGGTAQFLADDPPMTFAPGGYPGLQAAYGFRFGRTVAVPPEYGASFDALAQGSIDVLADFVVNPRLTADNLIVLDDDRAFFSAYYAAPIVRGDFLRRYPQARPALQRLAGTIDNRTMAQLNYAMETEGRDPAALARDFLVHLS